MSEGLEFRGLHETKYATRSHISIASARRPCHRPVNIGVYLGGPFLGLVQYQVSWRLIIYDLCDIDDLK